MKNLYRRRGKRALDLLISISLLTILAPLFLITALFIKLISSGPIFFLQERIGQHGTPFTIYKFRTMHLEKNINSSTTTCDDPRLFFGANLLRKFKIDELSQLFNVINGSMSLVGPRPTVKEDVRRMSDNQKKRLSVPPGLTGLAQISGNTSIRWPERIEYDLKYIEKQNFLLDLSIIAKTAFLVVTGYAETHPDGDDEWSV